jgi:hypothetical protein
MLKSSTIPGVRQRAEGFRIVRSMLDKQYKRRLLDAQAKSKQAAETPRLTGQRRAVIQQASKAAIRSLKSTQQGQALLKGIERQTRAGVARELFGGKKKSSADDPRVPHFAKIAQRMGMGVPTATGASSGAGDPLSSFDFPQSEAPARGAGNFTPPRPKKPGMPLRRQATNPRMRLLDAMNKGVA